MKKRITSAVGVAVAGRKEHSLAIERAMNLAMLQAIQDGETNPKLVRRRMMAARQKTIVAASEEAAEKARSRGRH